MKKAVLVLSAAAAAAAVAKEIVPRPEPVFVPRIVHTNEQPVAVSFASETAASNGLYRLVKTTITFTNPNSRVFEGELEFPVAEGATVCGYELEVNGDMIPGVVVGKEEARTAFENEKRKGIDPGVVEHVKGNVWRTRIYPLNPKAPRRASVTVLEPLAGGELTVVERDGDDVFVGTRRLAAAGTSRAERLSAATRATIFWDASFSRHGKVAADRALLEKLPEKGEWDLVVFRNVVEKPVRFTGRTALLAAVDALAYDGGTCLEEAKRKMARVRSNKAKAFLFTDEYDVEAAEMRLVDVRKIAADEKPPAEPKEGRLLAVAWAANRVADMSAQAVANKKELIDIGRRYGVASPVTSLIVLERLDQYLQYKIEPPKCMAFYDEWVKRRAAEDDPIAAKKAKADHENLLLQYWEERVKWWKDPIPPKVTPKSGLFERAVDSVREAFGARTVRREERMRTDRAQAGLASAGALGDTEEIAAVPAAEMPSPVAAKRPSAAAAGSPSAPVATVKIAAWDPKTPYLKAIGKAKDAYDEYLRQRETYAKSPAFFLDCAGWFFKAKDSVRAERILSNLSEMKLEDAGLWRTMGWRLREAGALAEAVKTFRHVLEMRGEEPQSRRDLALVLTERGKELYAANDREAAKKVLEEAMKLLHKAAFKPTDRRSGRRGNDMQTSVIALEELNGLISWCDAHKWHVAPAAPKMDDAFRRDMPLDLRIMMSWDTDETDVDIHVLEPDGEEAFYGHRRTPSGGFVSEDVTTGYGPEEYLRKEAQKGKYRILANYFASHRQALTGAAVVTATVYTGWGRRDEKCQILSFRLDKPKDKHPIGEITIE
ncbi:MAG: DUF2135 domain-containing protein [Kiritimatiellae bacterium]|nr:DUF2135 domain-containing protein [Kiritimatiellia bacterium]